MFTRLEWFRAVLALVGNSSPSAYTEDYGVAWTQMETFGPFSYARFNLLNTEEQWRSDGTAFPTTDFNAAGVKNYKTFADGTEACARVLQNGRYPALLAALRTNDDGALRSPSPEISAEIDTWGTHHAASIAQLASTPSGLRPGEQFEGQASVPAPSHDSGELPNYPFKNERTEHDINHDLDCVPDALASMLQYTTGKTFSGADLKDAVYGVNYVGGTSASAFVDYCRAHGGHLFDISGNGAQLVQAVRAELLLGRPVLATEPNPYGNPHFSHVVAFYKWDAHTLTVMDPFGAYAVSRTDAEWAALFLYHQVWAMERIGGTMSLDGWKDDGVTLTAPNGIAVVHGFREYVLSHSWDADDWPLEIEHAQSLDQVDPSAGATEQTFRKTVLEWDHVRGVTQMWVGQECLSLWKENAALRAQLKALAPVSPVSTLLKSDRAEIMATVAMLRDGADHLMEELTKIPGN